MAAQEARKRSLSLKQTCLVRFNNGTSKVKDGKGLLLMALLDWLQATPHNSCMERAEAVHELAVYHMSCGVKGRKVGEEIVTGSEEPNYDEASLLFIQEAMLLETVRGDEAAGTLTWTRATQQLLTCIIDHAQLRQNQACDAAGNVEDSENLQMSVNLYHQAQAVHDDPAYSHVGMDLTKSWERRDQAKQALKSAYSSPPPLPPGPQQGAERAGKRQKVEEGLGQQAQQQGQGMRAGGVAGQSQADNKCRGGDEVGRSAEDCHGHGAKILHGDAGGASGAGGAVVQLETRTDSARASKAARVSAMASPGGRATEVAAHAAPEGASHHATARTECATPAAAVAQAADNASKAGLGLQQGPRHPPAGAPVLCASPSIATTPRLDAQGVGGAAGTAGGVGGDLSRCERAEEALWGRGQGDEGRRLIERVERIEEALFGCKGTGPIRARVEALASAGAGLSECLVQCERVEMAYQGKVEAGRAVHERVDRLEEDMFGSVRSGGIASRLKAIACELGLAQD